MHLPEGNMAKSCLHCRRILRAQLEAARLEQKLHQHHILFLEPPCEVVQQRVGAARRKQAGRNKLREDETEICARQCLAVNTSCFEAAGELRNEIRPNFRGVGARREARDERRRHCGEALGRPWALRSSLRK